MIPKVPNEKILNYSVLESSRGKLQEYAMKNGGFHLKNSRWPCFDIGDATQGETHSASK